MTIDGFSTAAEMLAALNGRKVSAVELLDLHISRRERIDPALNAVVVPDFDRARSAAAVADGARSRGESAPLLGLPVTLKESINVEGLPTTCGFPPWRDERARLDSRVPARLKAAGAVLLGKTNLSTLLVDWQADNPIYGRTVNPWNPARTCGGSSGGAAAVAAGLTPIDVGSDIGGSIRVPAAFCGVYGHRPSETAVPRSGQFPGDSRPNAATVMGVQGPIARSADDLELAFDAIAGPDAGEDVAWQLRLPPARWAALRDARVAVLPPVGWLPVDGPIMDALHGLADGLRKLGARVETAQPATFGDLRDYYRLYLSLLGVMMTGRQSVEERREFTAPLRASGDPFALAIADGADGSAGDYLRWHYQREGHRAAYRAFFGEWDILLTPATVVPAFEHTTLPLAARRVVAAGRSVPYVWQNALPGVATLAGQPATVFPFGRTPDGLPIGLQAIGPYLEDRTPIRFAGLIAREFGGFERPPGFD